MTIVSYLKYGYNTFTDKDPIWIRARKMVERKSHTQPARIVLMDLEDDTVLMDVSESLYKKLIEREWIRE